MDHFLWRQFFHRRGQCAGEGGMVQVVMRAMGSSSWSFTRLPAAHLLLWGPVPNRPRPVPIHSPGVGGPFIKHEFSLILYPKLLFVKCSHLAFADLIFAIFFPSRYQRFIMCRCLSICWDTNLNNFKDGWVHMLFNYQLGLSSCPTFAFQCGFVLAS